MRDRETFGSRGRAGCNINSLSASGLRVINLSWFLSRRRNRTEGMKLKSSHSLHTEERKDRRFLCLSCGKSPLDTVDLLCPLVEEKAHLTLLHLKVQWEKPEKYYYFKFVATCIS